MIDRNAELSNQYHAANEFIEKLTGLIIEYRTEVSTGIIVGALETSKFRLLLDANELAEKEFNKEKGQE